MGQECLTADEIKRGHDEGRYLWVIERPPNPVSLEVWEQKPFLKIFKKWRKLASIDAADPEWEILRDEIEAAGQRIIGDKRVQDRIKRGLCPEPPESPEASERSE